MAHLLMMMAFFYTVIQAIKNEWLEHVTISFTTENGWLLQDEYLTCQ
jgi:hypothetical protein